MENNREVEIINLKDIAYTIYQNRKRYIKPSLMVFILSCIYIVSLPRYYKTDIKLAPEVDNSFSNGAIGSLASSFGFDLGNMQSSDAISPLLYPDLMDDNAFVAKLFPIRVKNKDGEIETSYYEYRRRFQKSAWWMWPINQLKKLFPDKEEGNGVFNPYILSKKDDGIIKAIRGDIKFSVEKKTGVITIAVQDQDPVICKSMADSVTTLLQQFITDYRTNKARIDAAYYRLLADSARIEYEKAASQYSRYADSNTNAVLVSYQTKLAELENDMQMKFNTYSVINTQLQTAKGKIQERTPAFTIIKGASVPVKPDGPKRMIFVFVMMILTFIVMSVYVVKLENKKV